MKKTTSVFWWGMGIVIAFLIWGSIPASVLPNGNVNNVTTVVQSFLVDRFGWFYLITATLLLGFAFFLIFSKYGKITLGKPDDKPEYSYLTWFAMLFSAGMGIGLVFWGASEPINHFNSPPSIVDEARTGEAGTTAIAYSFFHWGLHPWAIYAILALAIAYFTFRKQSRGGVISAILEPIFGKRVYGPLGKVIDVIAVFATIFGVATSLGLGAIQISGGISYLFEGIEPTFTTELLIIIIVTVLFIGSALSGLDRGIKILSNANIIFALLLMIAVLLLGPTNFILDSLVTSFGQYVQHLPEWSLRLTPYDADNSWIGDWTLFYWAWWIAWAPFVATFIARVSRGRTIREFVTGVLLVPTIFGAIWFAVFGSTAINMEYFQGIDLYTDISSLGEEVGLFAMLTQLPGGIILSVLALLLIATFFITSADSATFVLGMQTTNGDLNPSKTVKLIWGLVQSATAAILLWVGGADGLGALQTASIIAAFPFAIILILVVISLIITFKREAKRLNLDKKTEPQRKKTGD
ncbi:glycine betaine uptake BCCT transporter [Terribacillus saccharophilus]|uniref:glycine betaine uptake BCCT transporter n=1 Tax=Terribacillus saccharophilus TaxID=361277 RepID=UPI000BA52D19|nr:BCCT family transporter [Terribacillus saccharophilus]PAF16759.1 glycine/betaine ABC transporter permease [Terribacillus saccharophilus]PAF22022.1 glycine/betaine ABC transporter permease [Terribacillus saccharophilus]